MTTPSKETLRRSFSAEIEKPSDAPARCVDLVFATEAPVERVMGGERVQEILEVREGAVDLGRLNAGGPLLLEHEPGRKVGAVVKAWIGDDHKARARVKLSRSAAGQEIWNDLEDGIKSAVSVGYRLLEVLRVPVGDAVQVRAQRWEPLELSLVSIPADAGCGIGRSNDFAGVGVKSEMEKPEKKQMSIEIKEARNDAREIAALGNRHNAAADAAAYIERGESVEAFKTFLIEKQAAKPMAPRVFTKEGSADGVEPGYSLGTLLRAMADGRTLPEREALEHEKLSRTAGRGVAGVWVPAEVFRRTLTTASSPSFIGTAVQETIPALSADSLAVRLGARVIGGLTSKVVFPLASKAGAAFIAETATAADSSPDASGLTLDAKRLCAHVKVSKRLLAQGSDDVEQLIKRDIVLQLSLALDRAIFSGAGGVAPTGIINTAGVGSVAGPASRAAAVELEAAVSGADALGSSMAYVMTPAVASALKSEQLGTSGRFALESNNLLGYAAHASTQVPVDQLIFGNWAEVIIGNWGAVELVVDNSQAASGVIAIVANHYVDAGLRHAASFAKLS